MEGALHSELENEKGLRIIAVAAVSTRVDVEIMDRTSSVATAQSAVDSLTGQSPASESAHASFESAIGYALNDERKRAVAVSVE